VLVAPKMLIFHHTHAVASARFAVAKAVVSSDTTCYRLAGMSVLETPPNPGSFPEA
jgi:hypothetical protein